MELIESGALPAFQILGQWRIERVMLDRLIDSLYEQSAPPECDPSGSPAALDTSATPEPTDTPDAFETPDPFEPRDIPEPRDVPEPRRMTPQQSRIARLVAEGLSNAEIAERLSVEISTVKSHVSRMLQRLNIDTRQQLIAYLWRTGFITSTSTGPGPSTLARRFWQSAPPARPRCVRDAGASRWDGRSAGDGAVAVVAQAGLGLAAPQGPRLAEGGDVRDHQGVHLVTGEGADVGDHG